MRVNRVPMKTAAKLIIDSTPGHLTGGMLDHLEGFRVSGAVVHMQEKFERHSRRKLGGATKAAVRSIVVAGNAAIR